MRPVHLVVSLLGHLSMLIGLGLVSLALSQPAPPPPDTIRISFGQLPHPPAGGRRAATQKPADLPALEDESKPPAQPKPKELAKPKEQPKAPAPAKSKAAEPVKPVTKAQAEKSSDGPPAEARRTASSAAEATTSEPEADASAGATPPSGGTGPLAQQVGAGGMVQARGDAGAGDSYLGLVQSKIGRRWLPSPASTEGRPFLEATVSFRIGARGEVLDVAIFQSSGLSVFDREALRAVADSNPLPPPPARFRNGGLDIQFTFTYRP